MQTSKRAAVETKTKSKISQVQAVSFIMLIAGLFVLIASFLSNSSIAAIIGLGLTFWGALLLYIRPEESTRKILLEAAISPSLTTLNQIIQELGYNGDVTYLPPKYFANPETTKICVSQHKYASLPTPEQIQLYENQLLAVDLQVMILIPPGIELSRLLEKALGKSFIKTDLETLQQKLPKIFIEDLEIAETLGIQTQNDVTEKRDNSQASSAVRNTTIHARIAKPVNGVAFTGTTEPSIDCPICSAIAIAIAKATDKPVRIIDTSSSEDGDIIEASYLVIEE